MSNRKLLEFYVSERDYPNPYAQIPFRKALENNWIRTLKAYIGCKKIHPHCEKDYIVVSSKIEGNQFSLLWMVMTKEEYNNIRK